MGVPQELSLSRDWHVLRNAMRETRLLAFVEIVRRFRFAQAQGTSAQKELGARVAAD